MHEGVNTYLCKKRFNVCLILFQYIQLCIPTHTHALNHTMCIRKSTYIHNYPLQGNTLDSLMLGPPRLHGISSASVRASERNSPFMSSARGHYLMPVGSHGTSRVDVVYLSMPCHAFIVNTFTLKEAKTGLTIFNIFIYQKYFLKNI